MRNKFDNILLGTLWLLLSTLGACFWFNAQFGFNILSSTHWRHLAYMQVTRTQIKPSFYISIIVAVFCIVYGLYIFIRPHFRKIKNLPPAKKEELAQPEVPEITPNNTDVFALTRPKRLNTPQAATQNHQTETMAAPIPNTPAPAAAPAQSFTQKKPTTSEQHESELQEIFKSAGYIIKASPKIRGYKVPLIAIGDNETMWIGAQDIETSTMQSIIDTFQQIFSETLEDINIQIIGFVVNPGDITNPTAPKILTFKDTDALRDYMMQHPNPQVDSDSAENIEAFSEFISTVIDYIGNI